MFGHVLLSPVNKTLSRHDVISQPIVTMYSDENRPRTLLPLPINQNLSKHKIIWQRIVTIYSDDS